jgi:FMN phosphatase YigB (HAD superfamily)
MGYKKRAAIALLLGIACTSPLTIASEIIAPEKTKPIILWDLHGVVVQYKSKDTIYKMVSTIFNYDKKTEALYAKNSIALIKGMLSMTRQLWGPGASGEEFVTVAREHDDQALAELILQLLNCQTINPGTAAIIKKLHKDGYRQHIGSNMGEHHEFKALLTKQEPEFQEIFHHIFELDASQLVNYAAKPVIKKPNPEFFKTYLAKNGLLASQVLFIDDNQKNCAAARELGIDSIHFKNPEQLTPELKKRGVEIA